MRRMLDLYLVLLIAVATFVDQWSGFLISSTIAIAITYCLNRLFGK